MHEELLAAVRALRRLRREEARLLRRIEHALQSACPEGDRSGQARGKPSDELPEWISQEVDFVLSGAFDGEADLPDDQDAEKESRAEPDAQESTTPPSDPASYLLLGSAGEWVGFPWIAVDRVELLDESAEAESWPSLRAILGQTGPAADPEPFCIRFASGAGCITCQHVGGVVSLDEAARRGVECLLIPEITGHDAGVKVSLKPLVEEAALKPLVEEAALDDQAPPPGLLPTDRSAPRPPSRPVSPTGLVAIRYLPARVSISRALRGRGWSLRETPDLAEVPSRLRKVRYQAAFIEMVDDEIPDFIPTLRIAASHGCRVIAVGSRLRGHASNPLHELGDIPRLLYPFHESEVELILDSLRQDPVR